jgi:hypothetical protein
LSSLHFLLRGPSRGTLLGPERRFWQKKSQKQCDSRGAVHVVHEKVAGVHNMSLNKEERAVIENAKLCAERGWKGTFHLRSGETIEGAYITGTNWDLSVVSVERVGERHMPARIIYLKDVASIEVGWT